MYATTNNFNKLEEHYLKKCSSIYIHIPFCIKKCNYCSFNSFPINKFSNETIKKYFDSIIDELNFYKDILSSKLKTIYFGGGTPSLFEYKYFEKVLKYLPFSSNTEVTIEVNPGTVNYEKLKSYSEIGVNRISIGIQSFNDRTLKFLGRIHNEKENINCIKNVEKIFNNFSLDLIYALPGQTIDDLIFDLNKISEFFPPHISTYALSIEKNTKFYNQKIEIPSENIFSEMYDNILEFFETKNYSQYEISNFAKERKFCKHNLTYWYHKNYLGLGAGAFSFYNKTRWQNISNIKNYIYKLSQNKKPIAFHEKLSLNELKNEYIFLNFRKKNGLNLKKYQKLFNENFYKKFFKKIKKLENNQLLKATPTKIFLTKKGLKISNSIFIEFFV